MSDCKLRKSPERIETLKTRNDRSTAPSSKEMSELKSNSRSNSNTPLESPWTLLPKKDSTPATTSPHQRTHTRRVHSTHRSRDPTHWTSTHPLLEPNSRSHPAIPSNSNTLYAARNLYDMHTVVPEYINRRMYLGSDSSSDSSARLALNNNPLSNLKLRENALESMLITRRSASTYETYTNCATRDSYTESRTKAK